MDEIKMRYKMDMMSRVYEERIAELKLELERTYIVFGIIVLIGALIMII